MKRKTAKHPDLPLGWTGMTQHPFEFIEGERSYVVQSDPQKVNVRHYLKSRGTDGNWILVSAFFYRSLIVKMAASEITGDFCLIQVADADSDDPLYLDS